MSDKAHYAPISDWDRMVMIRTVVGEARGEPAAGKAAVAWVIRNRYYSGRFALTVAGCCLARKQFSCWNDDDPNRQICANYDENSDVYRQIEEIVEDVLSNVGVDPTGNSTHYCTRNLNPPWAEGHEPMIVIGNHKFYAGIR